jgi:hypothetical protein
VDRVRLEVALQFWIELRDSPQTPPQTNDFVAQPPQRSFDTRHRLEAIAVEPVRVASVAIELGLVVPVRRQTLRGHEAGNDAHGERPAAESETVDAVDMLRRRAGFVIVIATKETIDIEHVALQPEAEDAAEERERLKRRGADTVVVIGNLPIGIAQIERLVEPPDVGREQCRRRLPGPVRQKNNVLRHGSPPCGQYLRVYPNRPVC